MKGLLLKDFYMIKKYCKAYLLISVVFIGASLAGEDNLFFAVYPCAFSSMIPVTLLGYDERSRWLQYSGSLPCSKVQLVSAKYLVGLLAQLATLLLTAAAQAVRMHRAGGVDIQEYLFLMLSVFAMAISASSVTLPFIFKLGVEKGRIAYYIMIGAVCALGAGASNLAPADTEIQIPAGGILPVLVFAGIGMYALSWYLSVVFYQKRETS